MVSVSDVVVESATGEDVPVGRGVVSVVEPASDSGLACAEPGAENRLHSKPSVWSEPVGCVYTHKSQKPLGISSFLRSRQQIRLRSRLIQARGVVAVLWRC